MQDKYVADIGDWGKYGLLRALASDGIPLSVIWYLVHDEPGPDGRYIEYLGKPKTYKAIDATLFDRLRGLVDRRAVAAVQASGVLPENSLYFDERLVLDDIPALSPDGRKKRSERRATWFAKALGIAQAGGVVFVDPDNGFECASVRPHSKKGPKYVAWSEAKQLVGADWTLVAYHHLNRAKKGTTHTQQIEAVAERLQGLAPTSTVVGLRFKAYQSRAYMVVVPEADPAGTLPLLEQFLASGWSEFFARVV